MPNQQRNLNLVVDAVRSLRDFSGHFQACDFAPHAGGGLAQFSVVGGAELIAGKVMEVVDRVVNGCKALQMAH